MEKLLSIAAQIEDEIETQRVRLDLVRQDIDQLKAEAEEMAKQYEHEYKECTKDHIVSYSPSPSLY